MEISENTINILKNFASINAGILIKAGTHQLKTKSLAVFAKAEITENFPVDVAIYDLNEFLNVMSIFDEPSFDFGEGAVTISDMKNKKLSVNYRYASKDLISYPEKDLVMPEVQIEFPLGEDSLDKLMQAASKLVVKDISLSNLDEQTSITMKVMDSSNSSSNVFAIDVADITDNVSFDFHFKVENMKFIPGSYTLGLSSRNISRFVNNDMEIEYYVAMEKSSTYNEL